MMGQWYNTRGLHQNVFVVAYLVIYRFFKLIDVDVRGVTLAQLVKLLSCDWKVTGSSPGNNLLCKKQGKTAYNTPNGGTPSRTLRMREL